MTRENAMRKIRALVKVAAPNSGATVHEAATAKRMALLLMAAHDLKPDDFRAAAAPSMAERPWRREDFGATVSFTFTGASVFTSTNNDFHFSMDDLY